MLGIGVNTVLAIAAVTALPRLRMRLRRALGPALLVAAGLLALKPGGRLYLQRTQTNPAYQVVTGAVAVLVFLSLLNQLILFAAALTATITRRDPANGRNAQHAGVDVPASSGGRRSWRLCRSLDPMVLKGRGMASCVSP